MRFESLSPQVRQLMIDELLLDISADTLYSCRRLSEQGIQDYPGLLKQAILDHDPSWLADQLRQCDRLNDTEDRWTTEGDCITTRVPATAPDVLAEGEFNRFYIRALCRLALHEGISGVVVYRAKDVREPRDGSERLIGHTCDPQALLSDLRRHHHLIEVTELGVPAGPGSGLSVRLPGT